MKNIICTLASSVEHAQNGRGAKRSAEWACEFLTQLAARIRALCASLEHAQNGRGAKRSAERASEFLTRLAARIRALCASLEHAQSGRGAKRSAERACEFLTRLAARIRALCASIEHAQNGRAEAAGWREVPYLFGGTACALCALMFLTACSSGPGKPQIPALTPEGANQVLHYDTKAENWLIHARKQDPSCAYVLDIPDQTNQPSQLDFTHIMKCGGRPAPMELDASVSFQFDKDAQRWVILRFSS